MTSYEPWIGGDPDGPGCRVRWAPGWPACGSPVTIHILSESAIDGVICLASCERHAPSAREAGVYVDEHSPSHPGCRCKTTPAAAAPAAPTPRIAPPPGPGWTPPPVISDDLEPSRYGRPPYDPAVAARLINGTGSHLAASDGLTHSLITDDRGTPAPRCGAPHSDTRQLRLTRNWRVVSCPTCRTTETP